MSKLIECIALAKQYQMGDITVNALANVNLIINQGEYVAILGPSGSGKSTLMNILGCLDRPSAGQYYLNQKEVSHLSRNELASIRNQQIGFIFQSFNLLDYGSALDNVCLPLTYQGIKKTERIARATALLTQVGLADRLHHLPNELSGGQRQRVAIARALVTDPDVILADEPTGNLDTQSGQEITTLFKSLSHQGKTIIIVTHDVRMTEQMERIITIKDGHIINDSAPRASSST